MGEQTATRFASPERTEESGIQRTAALLKDEPRLREIMDAMPGIVVILNEHRQIVAANQALADAFGLSDIGAVYGLRPGEALKCIHADEGSAGCGTTLFCRTCGAVNVILTGLRGKKDVQECRIVQRDSGNAFDLRAVATPFICGEERLVIFALTDISHEKRREVLERAFFHDISNTLMGVMTCAECLRLTPPDSWEKLLERLSICVRRLVEEINSQRGLVAAEDGDLTVSPTALQSLDFLKEVLTTYNECCGSEAARVRLDDNAADVCFVSDKTLLARVVGNMLKNALEASAEGDTVLVGCELTDDSRVSFWVHNNHFMFPDTQLQVFNRSFSTKGPGRGIGTYSMKLLTERYLGGNVTFSSSPAEGTVFTVTLPLSLDTD